MTVAVIALLAVTVPLAWWYAGQVDAAVPTGNGGPCDCCICERDGYQGKWGQHCEFCSGEACMLHGHEFCDCEYAERHDAWARANAAALQSVGAGSSAR